MSLKGVSPWAKPPAGVYPGGLPKVNPLWVLPPVYPKAKPPHRGAFTLGVYPRGVNPGFTPGLPKAKPGVLPRLASAREGKYLGAYLRRDPAGTESSGNGRL